MQGECGYHTVVGFCPQLSQYIEGGFCYYHNKIREGIMEPTKEHIEWAN